MKNKQHYAVFTILLSIIITSCTANNKPFDSVSETQTSEYTAAAVSTAGNLDSTTETEQSISDTEVQTVPVAETEAEPVFMENAEKLDLECGKTTSEERDLDTILQEDYKSPTVELSSDKRYAAMVETTENYSIKSGFIEVFDSVTNTVTSMPYLEIQNHIHAEVQDTVNLYTCDLLSCEWITDDILKVNFDMKTGVSFYNQSNFGWYTYNLTEGKVTALSYEMDIPEPVENTMTDEEIKAVIDENLDILMTDSDEYDSENDRYYFEEKYIKAHPEAFETIVALGDVALPYLQEIGDKYQYYRSINESTSECRCYMATAAAYVINPMMYDLISTSSDGNYVLKASVYTFFGVWSRTVDTDYNFISIVETDTGAILASTKEQLGGVCNIHIDKIYWSPDSLYVVILEGDGWYFLDIIVLNIPDKTSHRIIDDLFNSNKIKELYGDSFSKYHESFQEWISDEQVKISFKMNMLSSNKRGAGWYIYDFIKNEIVEYTYEFFVE